MSITPDKRDQLRDQLRGAILDTLDFWAMANFPDADLVKRDRTPGAKDADLPELFKTVDAQFDRLLDRFGVLVVPETRGQAIKELGL